MRAMATLLDLARMPHVQESILQHLQVRDVIAFRFACRETQKWVNNASVKVKLRWGGIAAAIDLVQKNSFDHLTKFPVLISDLTITNYTTPSSLNASSTAEFLKLKAIGVKILRLDSFFGFSSREELAFVGGLSGLQELFVKNLRIKFGPHVEDHYKIPPTINSLRTLSLENTCDLRGATQQFWNFMSAPRFTTILKLPANYRQWTRNPEEVLQHCVRIVCERDAADFFPKLNYTHIDLAGFYISFEIVSYAQEMRQFFLACESNSVRVLNIPPLMMVEFNRNSPRPTFIDGSTTTVESILGWHWSLRALRSTSLRELRVPTSSNLDMGSMPLNTGFNQTYFWPNLQLIHITFNTDFREAIQVAICIDLVQTLHLGPLPRPQRTERPNEQRVRELQFRFLRKSRHEPTLTPSSVICPSSIVQYYPHVTSLKIIGWDAADIDWMQLWHGLLLLEELYLEDCKELGDIGFTNIRSNGESPTFLNLINLKKLTLKLDSMPRVTDYVFKKVIAHMPLQELYLHVRGNYKYRSLTQKSIEFLAHPDGKFRTSVKKFPFHTFAFSGSTDQELHNLKYKFVNAHY